MHQSFSTQRVLPIFHLIQSSSLACWTMLEPTLILLNLFRWSEEPCSSIIYLCNKCITLWPLCYIVLRANAQTGPTPAACIVVVLFSENSRAYRNSWSWDFFGETSSRLQGAGILCVCTQYSTFAFDLFMSRICWCSTYIVYQLFAGSRSRQKCLVLICMVNFNSQSNTVNHSCENI